MVDSTYEQFISLEIPTVNSKLFSMMYIFIAENPVACLDRRVKNASIW